MSEYPPSGQPDSTIAEGTRQRVFNAGDRVDGRAIDFPEVTGLCRTCSQALIRRQAYSEVPTIVCQSTYGHPHRVPLDVKQCTGYQERGSLSLYQMMDMATLIDERPTGGQYL